MAEALANEYVTTLNGAITDVATSIVVTTAPPAALSGGNFRMRLGAASDTGAREYILVGTVTGSTLTVTRGVEGSTAAAWATGERIAHVLTASGLSDALRTARSGTSFPASPIAGDLFFRTDLGYQFFWNSTVSRWLSTHVETYPISTQNAIAPATAGHTYFGGSPQVEAYYLDVKIAAWVGTTNDTSNYWTIQGDIYNGNAATNLGTAYTSLIGPNTWGSLSMTQNYLLAAGPDESQLGVTIGAGSPGYIFVAAYGRYRLALAS